MSNYFTRDKDGNWFISDGKDLFPVEYAGSMEIAYQQGIKDACDAILSKAVIKSVRQKLAEFSANECDKVLKDLKELNDKLERDLLNRGKPSEELR